jgi:hypothetical protein
MRTQPSGGRYGAPESRGRRSNHANRPAATNGPAPATCSTWTPSGLFASAVPATLSRVTATAPALSCGCGLASNGCTRSSTTTPPTPTASSIATSEQRPSPASSSAALAAFSAREIEVKAADERQRLNIHAEPSARRAARRTRHPPSLDPTPSPPGQRESRAVSADPQARVGARAGLLLQRPRPGAVTLGQLLQRAQITQLVRRPATHQPRPQRP